MNTFNDHYSSSAFHPTIFSYTLMRIFHGFAATIYYNKGEMRKTEVKDVTCYTYGSWSLNAANFGL
jgi:hypothetical protein